MYVYIEKEKEKSPSWAKFKKDFCLFKKERLKKVKKGLISKKISI